LLAFGDRSTPCLIPNRVHVWKHPQNNYKH
jgi:hypothetical protein